MEVTKCADVLEDVFDSADGDGNNALHCSVWRFEDDVFSPLWSMRSMSYSAHKGMDNAEYVGVGILGLRQIRDFDI